MLRADSIPGIGMFGIISGRIIPVCCLTTRERFALSP